MLRRLLMLTGERGGIVPPAPPVPIRTVFRRFWPDLRPYRRWIPLALAAIAVGAVVTTVEIWLFKLVVDQVLVPGDLGPLAWIAAAYLGLLLLGSLASFGDDYVSTWISESFVLDLRARTLAHIQALSPGFVDRQRLGDLLSRVTGDIRAIEGFMVGGVSEGLAAIMKIAFFGTALFVLEWRLALVVILVAPLVWLATRLFLRWIKEASREQRRRSGSLSAVAEGAIANSVLVTASNRQEHEVARLREQGRAAMRAELATSRISGLLSPVVGAAELIGVLGIVLLGTLAVEQGSLTLGGLLVFVTYLGKLFGPVRDLGSLGESLFEASAGAERVIEVLDREPEVRERPGAVEIDRADGRLLLRDVAFRYPDRDAPALRGLDLELSPGETVALIGPSGAGKSTLLKLLMRLHDPQRGSIRLDGHDLRDIGLRSLRRNVSVLLQEGPLMRGTVAENIAYSVPDAGAERIAAAARAAGAHDFIEALPGGYGTDVGERGRGLSGGQRQRVALARAFLEDAPVLILDEPTTGLDPVTRDSILGPLAELGRTRTTIVISHDPAVAALAHRSLLIDDGRLVGEVERARAVAA